MKYIFIIFVVWRVFKAIQKSMRPADKEAKTQAVPKMRKPHGQIESLGAVHDQTADYAREIVITDTASNSSYTLGDSVDKDRWAKLQDEAARFLAKTGEPVTPVASISELPPLIVAAGPDVPLTASETRVEMHSAYNRLALVRRGISLDQEALRTFVITREVLGPPRSRSRFRPGGRA